MQQYEGAIVRDPQGRRHKIVNGQPVPIDNAPEAAPGFSQIVAPRPDQRLPYQVAQEAAQAQAAPYAVPKAQADATIAQANAGVAGTVAQADAVKAQAQAALAQAQLAQEQAKSKGRPVQDAQAELARIISQIDAIGADAKDNGGWFETGYTGSMMRDRPGTAAYDLAKSISTIDANSAFSKLAQMRAESPTGGALGAVSEKELELLRSSVANLDPNQSQAAFLKNLEIARNHYAGMLKRIGGADPAPQQGAPRPMAMAPATNGYREVPDAPASAMIDKLVRAGVPYPQAIQTFRQQFPQANPFPQGDYDKAVGYARQNPGYKGSFGSAVKSEPLNAVENAINSVGNNAFGAYGVAAANALTAGTLDELSGNQERGQFAKDMLRQQNPGASLAGDITGSALGMVGVNGGLRFAGGRLAGLATKAGGLGGDALYGAAMGAGENNDNRFMGALTGAGAATAGNLVGRGLVSGAGRVARGVQSPEVGYLTERGVPLTPGQVMGQGGMFGRAVRGVEDKLTSMPFLGDAITQRRAEGVAAFNREAFNDALKPIGQQIEGNIGQGAIGQAQDLVGNAYGDALNGVRLRADKQFVGDVGSALNAGRAVPVKGQEFDYLMREQVGPLFGQNGTLDGPRLQAALQSTAKTASDFAKDGPMGQAAAGATRDVRNALTGLASRQAPDVMPQINAANGAYRNLSVLEDATLAAINSGEGRGIFTAAQLGNAMKANGKKFGGKKAAARGDMPFSELQEAGQALLPSTVPNSGTVDRAWGSLLLPGALGGAAYGANEFEAPAPVVASLAALAALSSKPGSAAFQKMAVKRSDGLKALGEELLAPRRKRLGGMFGSSLLLPVIAGP